MTNRRSSAVSFLHALLLAAEAVLLWIGLGWAVASIREKEFTTLLPLSAYPIGIAVSLMFSMGAMIRMEINLVRPGWADAMRLAFRQIFAVTCAVLALAVGLKDPGISRVFLAVFLSATGLCFVVLNRFQPGWLARLLYGGGTRLPTLILGDPALFPHFKEWLGVGETYGLEPIGVVAYRGVAPQIAGLAVAGEFAQLKSVIDATGARQVLMLNLPASADDAEHLAKICASCGCRLLIHNNLTFRLSYPLRVLIQDGYSFLAFQDEPLDDPLNRGLKRMVDLAVALPVVIVVLPLSAAVVWLVQRWQSPGPLFYLQPRSGRAGRTFRIVKFRTMHPSAGDENRQTAPNDDRVFLFGRFLRRASLDELPQFLNVLKGEMSVVGPRPHFVRHDDLFADAVNEYRVRFFVKPGITGLAQSRGLRGEMLTANAVHQRLELDLLYIHSWSVWLDFAIIARTVRQMVLPPPGAR